MNDALEVLDELQELINDLINPSGDIETIQQFIENQRSIYQPAKGECAA